jgi:hypothetical protein
MGQVLSLDTQRKQHRAYCQRCRHITSELLDTVTRKPMKNLVFSYNSSILASRARKDARTTHRDIVSRLGRERLPSRLLFALAVQFSTHALSARKAGGKGGESCANGTINF